MPHAHSEIRGNSAPPSPSGKYWDVTVLVNSGTEEASPNGAERGSRIIEDSHSELFRSAFDRGLRPSDLFENFYAPREV